MSKASSRKANKPYAISAYTPKQLVEALRRMYLIRRFEEKAEECYMRGLIHGTMHLSIGQEASAVGTCMSLTDDDKITSTHRGHGHCVAKGAEVSRMFAEFFGKETGYCRGRGGSMHIADVGKGNLGANGIVGGGIPIAVGAALAGHEQERLAPHRLVPAVGGRGRRRLRRARAAAAARGGEGGEPPGGGGGGAGGGALDLTGVPDLTGARDQTQPKRTHARTRTDTHTHTYIYIYE